MTYFIDVAYDSLNKYGEELCGDKVEIIRLEDSVIVVMADGLGSGVKANILSTLTSKIAGTMLKEGASIYETVDTIVHTLPVCNVRKLAYSTFTIIKIFNDGRVYTAEYDNPPIFFLRDNNVCSLLRKETIINGKLVKESEFYMCDGDILTVVSDGVIHAGVGAVLNLGWQWENVAEYLKRLCGFQKCAKDISRGLLDVCRNLYESKPGDDTTVVTVKMTKPGVIDLFTGPPVKRDDDKWVTEQVMKGKGKKIVCGGTAAKIISRELNEELTVNMDFYDRDVPPTAAIDGIDLVTEGVLTLSKAVEKIRNYLEYSEACSIKGRDGASQLAAILINECTHLRMWVGKAVNPAHQNPDLPVDLSIKLKLVDELKILMERLGKKVEITYI